MTLRHPGAPKPTEDHLGEVEDDWSERQDGPGSPDDRSGPRPVDAVAVEDEEDYDRTTERQMAYYQGRDEERAAVVAWLAAGAPDGITTYNAESIARGEHWEGH